MKVRYANLDDVPKIVEIYSYYVLNKPYTFETEVPTIEEYKNRMIEFKKFFPFFVLEDENGEVVGYSYAHFYHERRAYQWNAETTIYIQEGLQRKGLGSMLYKPLLDALKDQGFTNALAILGCPNESSENFHKKMGFKNTAVFEKQGFKLGEWHDVAYFDLLLNEKSDNPKSPIPFSQLDPSKYITN